MNRNSARLLAAVLCLCSLPHAALPQQPAASPQQQPKKTQTKKKAAAEADPMAEVRRASAVTLVASLAEEARTYRDSALAARVQARAADALWDSEPERARTLFRRAWDAAESADREAKSLTEEERRERGGQPPSVRREVVGLAAKHDRALGEEFLTKMDESRKSEDSASPSLPSAPTAQTPAQRYNPDEPPASMAQRLSLAQQLLEDGDTERAVQFAGPALYPVNTLGISFLNTLRERDKASADFRFQTILVQAANDPSADANYVSLLASYVFTPYLYVTVRPDGASHTRRRRDNNSPPEDMPAGLRNNFLNTAAQILLRPLPPPDQDRSSSGRTGAYVVLTRLLPFFDRYAPDRAAALRARQSLLAQDTPEQNRRPDDPILTRGIAPEDPNRDQVQEALDRLGRAKDANERDFVYYRAAMAALDKDPDRARELAEKIEDADTRSQLVAYMAFQRVRNAVREKKAEEALRLVRNDQLTPMQRVWGLTEAARLLAKSEPGRATEALDEAAADARRMDEDSPDRVRALVAIATQMAGLDRTRVWELMNEVVKSVNALPDYSGEGETMTMRVRFKGGGAMTQQVDAESFDLTGLFDTLAREDFDRASALARTLKGDSPRSVASLAVARSVLAKPKAAAQATAN
ncbi:MAG TPA: hypothetical protein VM914_05435 [Pyrinomonadaceae bacterium]|nr:hypothetical protein [Pyrinomonadaceae bacterium]